MQANHSEYTTPTRLVEPLMAGRVPTVLLIILQMRVQRVPQWRDCHANMYLHGISASCNHVNFDTSSKVDGCTILSIHLLGLSKAENGVLAAYVLNGHIEASAKGVRCRFM